MKNPVMAWTESVSHEIKRNKLKPAVLQINDRSDLTIKPTENKGGRKPRSAGKRRRNGESVWRTSSFEARLNKQLATYSLTDIEAYWRFTVDRVNEKSNNHFRASQPT
jgi:hypothetical protein